MPQQHRPFARHPCAASHPELISQAQTFLALAIGDATRATYATGIHSYITFVDQHRIQPAFPAGLETLCLWVSHLASPQRRLTLATCKTYLTAVISRHVEMGLVNPLIDAPPLLDRVLAGIKRATARSTRPKLPITTTILRDMRRHVDPQNRRDSLLWAMMWTATAGLLRISEFTTSRRPVGDQSSTGSVDSDRILCTRQLTLVDNVGNSMSLATAASTSSQPIDGQSAGTNIHHAVLRLDASKTDPLRTGVDIVLASRDALQALLNYGTHCHARFLSPSSPLFHFDDGVAVNRNWLMRRVNELLVLIGRDPRSYSSHSFRKGGAVSLQERGVEDSLIRKTGRWRSDAFHLYVRHPSLDTLVESNAQL
jgi:hypothetical protein